MDTVTRDRGLKEELDALGTLAVLGPTMEDRIASPSETIRQLVLIQQAIAAELEKAHALMKHWPAPLRVPVDPARFQTLAAVAVMSVQHAVSVTSEMHATFETMDRLRKDYPDEMAESRLDMLQDCCRLQGQFYEREQLLAFRKVTAEGGR